MERSSPEDRTEVDRFREYLESRKTPGTHVVTSLLENKSSKPLRLIVEPWATDVLVPPGGKCEIVAEEPVGEAINLTFADEYVQVWAGGIAETFQNGQGNGTTGHYLEWRDKTKINADS
jgi:hypothetical protein